MKKYIKKHSQKTKKSFLYYAMIFALLAIIIAALGFGLVGIFSFIAKFFFYALLILAIFSVIAHIISVTKNKTKR